MWARVFDEFPECRAWIERQINTQRPPKTEFESVLFHGETGKLREIMRLYYQAEDAKNG